MKVPATTAPARGRVKVLLLTGDLIRSQMAGPAIRVWNMAEELAPICDVRIVSWRRVERSSDHFELHHVRESDDAAMKEHEAWADVIIVQGVALRTFPTIRRTSKTVVADLYDPFQLEQLEQNKHEDQATWAEETLKAVSLLNEQIARADFFLCASERQRDLWLGNLSALGRLNPQTYAADPTFNSLIGVVPFGLPEEPPRQTRHAIKGTVPGIGADDKVVLWGGGIYNWFDPKTLVESMALIADTHPQIKLFFLSAKHFNSDVPEMQAAVEAHRLATDLGLIDRNVFFNQRWVDYDDRVNFLLDADVGVSTHLIHAETRFSFRTRILDYLWAGLPVVATDGDSFADVIRESGCGRVVAPNDAVGLRDAIVELLSDDLRRADAGAAAVRVRESFVWSRALRPLVDFCASPKPAADRTERSSRSTDKAMRFFERALSMPPGLRRDVALLAHYFRRGGMTLVRKKLRDRGRRLTRDD